MPTLAIVTSSPPGIEGGHMVIARALVTAARAEGHDAHLLVTADFGFGRNLASYRANWRAGVSTIQGRTVDQVISLRYPSYAVRHPRHLCWLNHAMREYYDLWPRFAATLSARALVKEHVRKAIVHAADRWLLTRHVTEVVAQSKTIQDRLAHDFGIKTDVLWPPPPPRPYRCDEYGDFIFAVSRLTPLKRLGLLVRALAEPAARHVRVAIAGEGPSRAELEELAGHLGVADRVTWLGRIDEATLVDRLARCRAVCFVPFGEDYGFVTVEAFASRKAVVTCRDSGGPAELVTHDATGLVCDPTPSSIASALAGLTDDRALAERLGQAAAAQAAAMTWRDAVKRLVLS
jgi:glycosyltransferase involved in cell wall biosynthesis